MTSISTMDPTAIADPELLPPPMAQAGTGGALAVNTFGAIVTAQRVAVPRNEPMILQKLRQHCAAFGQAYVYSWQVNDNANQRKSTVEGGTIKLANDLARLYGNNVIDVRVEETERHTIFYARFTDLETGFSMTRPFRQRAAQNVGKRYDAERAADMVFQIGVSKAIRNVVLNALSTYAAYAVEESKKSVVEWLSKGDNKDKAWAFISRVMTENSIDIKQVEAVLGRPQRDWTVQNLARVMMEMRGIDDGLTVAAEVYPSHEAAAVVTERKDTKGRLDDLAGATSSAGASKAKSKSTQATTAPEETATATTEQAVTASGEAAHDPDTGEIAEDDVPAFLKAGKAEASAETAPLFGDD